MISISIIHLTIITMKKTRLLLLFYLFLINKTLAQNGQNIELSFTKPSKILKTEKLNLWKYGSKGAGIITTQDIAVTLQKPEPFIAFSVAIEGLRIDASLVEVSVQTKQDGTWSKEWQPVEYNSDADNSALKMMTNMLELDKSTTAIRVRFYIKSNDIRLKKAKIRLFAAGNISTGSIGNNLELRAACAVPPSVSRAVWGAQWSLTDDKIYKGSATITPVTHLIVHHSAGNNASSNWAAVVASYFDLHVNTNGWSDIGYNWLIAPDGQIFVGRGGGNNVVGAHMCGYNVNTMGVCLIGNFTTVEPAPLALNKLKQLLAWKASDSNIDPLGNSAIRSNYGIMNNISGHRDGCSPDYTECPGNLLYAKLTTLRQDVKTALAACTTASNELFTQNDIKIFPNPNEGQFSISIKMNEKAHNPLIINVLSIDGRIIFEKKINENLIDINEKIELDNAAKGTYLVRISDGQKSTSKLIAIQ